MSLIEEALRRIQDPAISKAPPGLGAGQPAAARREHRAHSWPTTSEQSSQATFQTQPHLIAVAVAVLCLTVVLLVGGTLWLRQTFSAPPTAPAVQVVPATLPPATIPVQVAAPVRVPAPVQESALVQKPAPPIPAQPTPTYVLTGVVQGRGQPYAVINGQIVAVGELVGTARLLQITDAAVRLRTAEGEEFELHVPR